MPTGWKTYLAALLMLLHGLSGWILGDDAGWANVDWTEVFTALGLASLRHAVARK